MAKIDVIYHNLARGILETGYEYVTDNRDIPCKQITSANMEIPLTDEFPLITTKKMFTKGIVEELLWFLRGDTSSRHLRERGVTIWDKDAYSYYQKYTGKKHNQDLQDSFLIGPGDVGRNYGAQWRNWAGLELIGTHQEEEIFIDQITQLLDNLRKPNPINRRHIVTAWNPAEIDQTALPPCHWAFEVLPRPLSYSQKIELSGGDKEYLNTLWSSMISKDQEAKEILDRELSSVPNYGFILKWHQRSVDTFLGLPFNIASYAILAHIIGSITNMIPLSIIGDLSNVHFYTPHIEAVQEQLDRSPIAYPGTKLIFSQRYLDALEAYKTSVNGFNTFDTFIKALSAEDFIFENYKSFGPLKAEMYEPTK